MVQKIWLSIGSIRRQDMFLLTQKEAEAAVY